MCEKTDDYKEILINQLACELPVRKETTIRAHRMYDEEHNLMAARVESMREKLESDVVKACGIKNESKLVQKYQD